MVYPRAYGEYRIYNLLEFNYFGLSPCLRGIPDALQRELLQMRFIPVLTGNTRCFATRVTSDAVYPRAYGEYVALLSAVLSGAGLSPCLRGILLIFRISSNYGRFIPVLTGNTHTQTRYSADFFGLSPCLRGIRTPKPDTAPISSVYPRAYGEYDLICPTMPNSFGLSPCLRGIRI